jgi:hydrogenase maturation protein HypF
LVGSVRNTPTGARIEVQGAAAAIDAFADALTRPPAPVELTELQRSALPDGEESTFAIADSSAGPATAGGAPLVSDLRTCDACLVDLEDPSDRRFRYPFTTCTDCGPRYTITRQLPYDRVRTSMAVFPLCRECQTEFADPSDRRFHAQPIACGNCGPTLSFETLGDVAKPSRPAPLEAAVEQLRSGKILGLLGLGGYQLLVDAEDDRALRRLRERKARASKPFAVLFADLEQLSAHCTVTPAEALELSSPRAPIVLLDARESSRLSELVAPGSARVGAMLPTTPLHHLLVRAVERPLVCTSGNLAGEPLCTSVDEARERLGQIADALLGHDREVVRGVDDSVGQVVNGEFQLLRRARGYVPGATAALASPRAVLALGAHQKSTFTVTCAGAAFTSPHLGDLDTTLACQHLERRVTEWLELLAVVPERVVCDLHPGYASSELARQLAKRWDVPLERVQHHHAHIAAVIAEHALDGEVLGLAWDGTGLGTDGTLWGGEALRCNGRAAVRVSHLRPFRLPGGSAAIREPRRAALGLLHEAKLSERGAPHLAFSDGERAVLAQALRRGVNAPVTSSVGRLFDAVAALCGVRQICDFEGQAAIEWTALAERAPKTTGGYTFTVETDGVIDWRPLLEQLLEDQAQQVRVERIARRFHEGLVALALELAERHGLETVALGGGCFQNRLLVERISERLTSRGFRVAFPKRVPPSDGGISLGQAWVACHDAVPSKTTPAIPP